MTRRSAARQVQPVHLLDLPPGWLASVILALKKGEYGQQPSIPDLSRTCHMLHDLVLNQAAVVPTLMIQTIQQMGTSLHVRALAMAEAVTSNLHVKIKADCREPKRVRTRWVDTFSRAASLHAQRTPSVAQQPAVPYQLQCVTWVTLAGSDDDLLHLDTLIPDFVEQVCPNLRQLTLDRVRIAASPAGPLPAVCTSLKSLTLGDIRIPGGGAASAAVKQQLLSLPRLTSLHFNSYEAPDFQAGSMYRAAIDRYSSQLKELVIGNMTQDLPWSPGTQFPHLQLLTLGRFSVDSDAVLQQLMQAAPNVVVLELSCIKGLETSFAQEPCRWQELTLGEVYVDQLAKLPLTSCTHKLICKHNIRLSSKDGPKPTPEQIAAGAASAQAAGGMQFGDDLYTVWIHLYDDDLQRIPAAQPILEQLKDRECVGVFVHSSGTDTYAPWSEAQPVFAVLGQHFRCRQALPRIEWKDHPGAYAQLPQLLPHVEGFNASLVPNADVIEMCRTATRPFTLQVDIMWGDLKQRLQQVMQEAGHQLVTVVVPFELNMDKFDVDEFDYGFGAEFNSAFYDNFDSDDEFGSEFEDD